MDIIDFQKRLTDFMISQMTSGPGYTDEAQVLREELDAAIAEFGDQIPDLKLMAEQLDLLREVQTNPELAASLAEASNAEFVPEPEIFDAIADHDFARIETALSEWDINQPHGEFEKTALYAAMSDSMDGVSPSVVSLLLDKGADPKIGLGSAYNVLHGLGFGRIDPNDVNELASIIRRCIDLGADIEQRSDNLQWTPLITAASEWNAEALEALILAGADTTARAGEVDGVCFSGETARAFADGHPETMAVLERYSKPT